MKENPKVLKISKIILRVRERNNYLIGHSDMRGLVGSGNNQFVGKFEPAPQEPAYKPMATKTNMAGFRYEREVVEVSPLDVAFQYQ